MCQKKKWQDVTTRVSFCRKSLPCDMQMHPLKNTVDIPRSVKKTSKNLHARGSIFSRLCKSSALPSHKQNKNPQMYISIPKLFISQKGLRELLEEVEFPADLVHVPLGWLVETDRHNPLYTIFRITGEQIYNWGLLHGKFLSWLITWLTSWAQYIALQTDGFLGALAESVGITWYGDHSAKITSRVCARYQPDMVRNFLLCVRVYV
jgi:hypothetical protein